MVVTLALNPALDVTARVDILRLGRLNRLSENTVNAGGKGIVAARMVRVLGGETLVLGFFGGSVGALLQQMLTEEGLPHAAHPIAGKTRVNTKLLDDNGNMTEFNGTGGTPSPEDYQAIESLLLRYAVPGTVVVLSGSLPPGADPGLYAHYIKLLHERGVQTLLDTSGEALRLGAAAQPDILKPNADEIGEIDRAVYGGFLAWSLGAEGARFFAGGTEWFIPALPLDAVSPAGAGDCMAGALAYALQNGLPLEEASLLACAAASAAVMTPGTNVPALAMVETYRGQLTLQRC